MRLNVERHDMNRSLRNFLMEGIFLQTTTSLLSVTVISSYLATIGASPLQISLLVAIPHFTTSAQIIFAKFVETRNRKKITFAASLSAKISLICISITAFFDGEYEIVFFTIFYLIYNICEDVYTVTWSSWMRDLLPGAKRGEIISKRSIYGKILAVFAILPQIWIFEKGSRSAFSLFFGLAAIFGILGALFLIGIENVKSNRLSEARLRDPLKNFNFLKLSFLAASTLFVINSAKTFFAVYVLKVLNYPLYTVFFLLLVSHLSSMYSYRIAGIFSDRLGNKTLFLLILITFSISASIFSIIDRNSFYLLVLAYVLYGFYTSAPNIALTNAVADLSHKKHSAPYYALINWLVDVFSALGCIFGGVLLTNFLPYGDLAYKVLFMFSVVISITLIPFLRIYDEFSPPTIVAISRIPEIITNDFLTIGRKIKKLATGNKKELG